MNEIKENYFAIERQRMRIAFVPTIVLVCILWLIFILDSSLTLKLYQYGVYPLNVKGLPGVFFSPFIHHSAKHLLSNTLPLLVLMWCLYYFYSAIAHKTFLLLWFLSGLLTWTIGREAWHIGASGVIYSLSFFLFFSGIFRKHIPLIAISLIVAFLYGSTIWNMLPWSMYLDATVSWEGHLAGAISGLIVALMFYKHGPQKPIKVWMDDDDNEMDDDNNVYGSYCRIIDEVVVPIS